VCICALWGRDWGQGCRDVEVMVAMFVCEHTSDSHTRTSGSGTHTLQYACGHTANGCYVRV